MEARVFGVLVKIVFRVFFAQLRFFLLGGFSMPLPTQTILFFSLPTRSQGWSESLYSNLSPESANSFIENNIGDRLAVLAKDCRCIGYRSSVMGPPRESLLRLFSPPRRGTGGVLDAQNAESCILYRMFTATRNRLYTFRGIPDEWITDGERTPSGVDAHLLFSRWLLRVIGASFGLTTPNPANPISQNADLVTLPGGSRSVVVTNPVITPTLALNDLVRIRGAKRNRLLNGLWKVSLNDATSFNLNGSGPYYVDFDNGSSSQKIVLMTDPFISTYFSKCSVRNTGRVFGVGRGRRPAQVRRR